MAGHVTAVMTDAMHQITGRFITGLLDAVLMERYSSAGSSGHGWCPSAPARAAAGSRRVAARLVAAWDASSVAIEAQDGRSLVAVVTWKAATVFPAKPIAEPIE